MTWGANTQEWIYEIGKGSDAQRNDILRNDTLGNDILRNDVGVRKLEITAERDIRKG